jgi:hypothetical protein
MRHRLIGVSLLLAAFVALPAMEVHGQGKKKKDQVKTSDSDKLSSGDFTGTLKSVPGTDRMFTLEVETKQLVPTGRVGRGSRGNNLVSIQNRINQATARLASARTPGQRNSAMRQLVQAQAQLDVALLRASGIPTGYRVNTIKTQIEFQATETVKVRTMVLPEQFDDKGNPKKYTKEELTQLKGKDKNLVGYESSLEKLEVGQKLKVTLVAVKKKPVEKDKENKDLDKDKDESEKKMQVKLIVIQQEPTDTAPPGKRGKKNN